MGVGRPVREALLSIQLQESKPTFDILGVLTLDKTQIFIISYVIFGQEI